MSSLSSVRPKKVSLKLPNYPHLFTFGCLVVAMYSFAMLNRLALCPNPTSTAWNELRKQPSLAERGDAALSDENGSISSNSTGTATTGRSGVSTSVSDQNKERRPTEDVCESEFERTTANKVRGLTSIDMERSVAYTGNRQRIAKLVRKLQSRQEAVTVVVCGGSITLGHGIENPKEARYSGRLQQWLNETYPLTPPLQHTVYNRGSHGADVSTTDTPISISCFERAGHSRFST
jgi:hypothetical protein